jgi:hypothetical protein
MAVGGDHLLVLDSCGTKCLLHPAARMPPARRHRHGTRTASVFARPSIPPSAHARVAVKGDGLVDRLGYKQHAIAVRDERISCG